MKLFELFKNEITSNRDNPRFAPIDDEVMGKRGDGFFCRDFQEELEGEYHECQNIIFDNGSRFVFDKDEQKIYTLESVPEDYFIHKYLEKIIYDYKEKYDIKASLYCGKDEIEARPFIRLLLYRQEKVVYLHNIMLPMELRGQGIGLQMISEIYAVCKKLGYRLVLVQMMERFYDRMVRRGAKVLSLNEVEITDETNLGLM